MIRPHCSQTCHQFKMSPWLNAEITKVVSIFIKCNLQRARHTRYNEAILKVWRDFISLHSKSIIQVCRKGAACPQRWLQGGLKTGFNAQLKVKHTITEAHTAAACARVCVCYTLHRNTYSTRKVMTFWFCQLQRTVLGLKLGFRVEVRIGFRLASIMGSQR